MTTFSRFLAINYQFINTSNHVCFEKLKLNAKKLSAQKLNALDKGIGIFERDSRMDFSYLI